MKPMPFAKIDGAHIAYEIVEPSSFGSGPALALSPGGRNPMGDMRDLARLMAAAGYRVLLHDRRNCGTSDVGFDPARSEYEMWADDLHAMLGRLGMLPAIVGGSSSGARLALTLALRHREAVRALLLMRVTGGRFAIDRLVEKYYDSNARAARAGGMAAVCETEHFAQIVSNRPENRAALMAMNPADFIACMEAWRRPFVGGIDLPLIGTTEGDLRSIAVPACIIPGNDLTHPRSRGAMVAALIPGSELHGVTDVDRDVDVTPADEWGSHYPAMARIFTDFLKRRLPD
jgi:pimeloyl-ACP methyl ester carboxylesterase